MEKSPKTKNFQNHHLKRMVGGSWGFFCLCQWEIKGSHLQSEGGHGWRIIWALRRRFEMVTMENQKGVSNKQGAALRLLWGFSQWMAFLMPALVWGVDYKAVSGWPRVKPSRGPPCPGAMLRAKHQPARLSVLLHTQSGDPAGSDATLPTTLFVMQIISHYRASSFIPTSTQTNGGFERGLPIQQHFNRHSQTLYLILASPGPHLTPPGQVKECSPWQHYGFSSTCPLRPLYAPRILSL